MYSCCHHKSTPGHPSPLLKKPKKMKQKQEIFSSPPGTLQDPLIFLVWPVSKLRTQRKEQPGFWPLLPSDKTQVYTVLTCGNHQLHCICSYHLEFIKDKNYKCNQSSDLSNSRGNIGYRKRMYSIGACCGLMFFFFFKFNCPLDFCQKTNLLFR